MSEQLGSLETPPPFYPIDELPVNLSKSESGFFHTSDNLYDLPYQIIGNVDEAETVFVVHHGGPGDSIQPSHVEPIIKAIRQNPSAKVAILLYTQRASGRGDLRSKFLGTGDPIESHTPDNLVVDVEQMRLKFFRDKQIVHFGGSWGSMLALLHAETFPDSVQDIIISGVTLGEDEETNKRYTKYGRMATHFPGAYRNFIKHLPKGYPEDGMSIVEYYAKVLRGANLYAVDIKKAKKMAAHFGLLHTLASDPDRKIIGFIPYSTIVTHLPTRVINAKAKKMGMDPLSYSRLAMEYFSDRIRNQNIIGRLGKLAGKRLFILSGKNDLITDPEVAEKLEAEAKKLGIFVVLASTEEGHDRSTGENEKVLTGFVGKVINTKKAA